MSHAQKPHEIIRDLVADFAGLSDDDVLAEIKRLPPLEDEEDPLWDDDRYWIDYGYRYVALSDLAAQRKLRPAVRLLLERACKGDPGEIMRGLRHACEAIFRPDWSALADVCMEVCKSSRQGARIWSLHQLATLDDPRARLVFENALLEEHEDIRLFARVGIERLERLGN